MIRELREETGYQAKNTDLKELGRHVFNPNQEGEYMAIVYCLILSMRPDIMINRDEHTSYMWVDPEKLSVRHNMVGDSISILKFHKYL